MNIKQQSTGDEDSVEDALIAIVNIKTEDGKLVDLPTQIEAVLEALNSMYHMPQQQISDEAWMDGVKVLAAIVDSHLLSSKPLNKWIAPKPLSEEEILDWFEEVTGHDEITDKDIRFARAIEYALLDEKRG